MVSIFGGGIYGYTTAIIAGLSGPLVSGHYFPSSAAGYQAAMQGLLTAIILLGGLLGALWSMPLTARFGRKCALVVCGAICAAMSLVMGFVHRFAALVALRGILGLSIGMSATICPLYNAETVAPEKRGVVGTVFQISVVLAILLAEVVNYAFNPSNRSSIPLWTADVQFLLGGLFGVGLIVLGLLVPESNSWLEARRRKAEKRAARAEGEAKRLVERRRAQEEQAVEAGTSAAGQRVAARAAPPAASDHQARELKGWRGLCHLSNLRWLALAFLLAAGNQLTGINAIIYYAPRIFKDAGFERLALVLTIGVVGSWNFVSVLLSMPLIRVLSRRRMMLIAVGIMCAGMLLMSLSSFFLSARRAIPSIVAILLVILGFEIGPGPLFFVLASEAFPSRILHAGLSLANQLAWACNIAISFLFPLLNEALGAGVTFALFFASCLATLLAFAAVLPADTAHHVITAVSESPPIMMQEGEGDEEEEGQGETTVDASAAPVPPTPLITIEHVSPPTGHAASSESSSNSAAAGSSTVGAHAAHRLQLSASPPYQAAEPVSMEQLRGTTPRVAAAAQQLQMPPHRISYVT